MNHGRQTQPFGLLIAAAILVAACSSNPASSPGSARPVPTLAGGGGAATPATTLPATTLPAAVTAAPAGASAACDWVTESEMTAILAGAVAPPNRPKAKATSCDWTSADISVHINIHQDTVEALNALRAVDTKAEDVAVGEGGIWSPLARGLFVKKGGRALAVQILFLPNTLTPKDVAIAIAGAALPRF